MDSSLFESFIKTCIHHLDENLKRIQLCLDELNEDEVWFKSKASLNSTGVLINHLNGNMTQYILSALGGQTDKRNREAEFKSPIKKTKIELFNQHARVVNQCVAILKELKQDNLLNKRKVQGFEMNGIEILVHVVEHYSYHTGQIAYAVKLSKDKDLGFYSGLDLNLQNEID